MVGVVVCWCRSRFGLAVLAAAIKAVPDAIVEAAKIDGATGMRLFRSITIPTIRPTLVVVITTVAIASLKTFDIVAAHPMWNQNNFSPTMYEPDSFAGFAGGIPSASRADRAWRQPTPAPPTPHDRAHHLPPPSACRPRR